MNLDNSYERPVLAPRHDYGQMVRDLRGLGITARIIVNWGRRLGWKFTQEAIKSIAFRDSTRVRHDIATTIADLHKRLCS